MSCEAEARKRVIYRVTFVGFVVNLALTAMKFAAGIVGRSGAMVADAVHSCSDMATDVVVIAFAKISAKPRDDGHDYGHGKYETLATIIISLALAAVGAGILLSSIRAIRIVVDGGELPRPGAVEIDAPRVLVIAVVDGHGIGIAAVAREGEHTVRAVFEYFFCLPLGQFALCAPHISEHIISPCGLVEKFAKSIL